MDDTPNKISTIPITRMQKWSALFNKVASQLLYADTISEAKNNHE